MLTLIFAALAIIGGILLFTAVIVLGGGIPELLMVIALFALGTALCVYRISTQVDDFLEDLRKRQDKNKD